MGVLLIIGSTGVDRCRQMFCAVAGFSEVCIPVEELLTATASLSTSSTLLKRMKGRFTMTLDKFMPDM